MEFTNEEMVKSLTSLIDETLEEIEEIKKSKFAASEISLGDDKSGVADRSKNGKLEAKKAEDEDEEDEEDEDSDDMDKADWAKKSDCMDKADDEDEDEDEDEEDEDEDEEKEKMSKGMKELKFSSKKELKAAKKPDAEGKKLAAKYGGKKPMKKSEEDEDSLMKSYVDERFSSLEKTISKLAAAVEAIADAPVQRKGVPAGVTALQKSHDEVEPLSKSDVANKLFELKKTGKSVDSADIFKVETGNNLTVLEIANKYGLR